MKIFALIFLSAASVTMIAGFSIMLKMAFPILSLVEAILFVIVLIAIVFGVWLKITNSVIQ
jgi:hypothetical protein